MSRFRKDPDLRFWRLNRSIEFDKRLAPYDIDQSKAHARGLRGVASKAYLPCIHLFPHLRQLGYREGQFPVAEAASRDSLALPFFPAMGEAQVDRVCQELAAALGRA